MANPWFKFYANDYLSEPKLKGVSTAKKSCFITALCYAANYEGNLDTRDITSDLIKIEAGVRLGGPEWDEVGDIFEWLTEKRFGHMENEVFVFKNWGVRQVMTPYERVKKYREKMKNDNENDNAVITAEQNRTDKKRTEEYFDRFWEKYPKKIGKADALRAFRKIKPDEELTSRIISAVESHMKTDQWKDNDGRYIPYPATFLNRAQWEDEIAPKKKEPKILNWEKTEKGMRPVYEPSEFAKSLNKRI